MSKDYWFPWSPARFRADTMHLTAEQDGIYRRLIDHYMETGLPVMDNDQAIARIAGVLPDIWAGVADVIRAFFQSREGKLFNKRCDEILADQAGRKSANSSKSTNGANSRWQREDQRENTQGTTRSQRLAAARLKGTHTDADWRSLLDVCGYLCCKCKEEEPLVKDHIKPLYKGGSDSIDNIQPLCRKCNSAKGPDESDLRPPNWKERLRDACQTPATGQNKTIQNNKEEPPEPPDDSVATYFDRNRLNPEIPAAWLAECMAEMSWAQNVAADIWTKFSGHQGRKIGQAALKTHDEWAAEWRTWYRKENIRPSGASRARPAEESVLRTTSVDEKQRSNDRLQRFQGGNRA